MRPAILTASERVRIGRALLAQATAETIGERASLARAVVAAETVGEILSRPELLNRPELRARLESELEVACQ